MFFRFLYQLLKPCIKGILNLNQRRESVDVVRLGGRFTFPL